MGANLRDLIVDHADLPHAVQPRVPSLKALAIIADGTARADAKYYDSGQHIIELAKEIFDTCHDVHRVVVCVLSSKNLTRGEGFLRKILHAFRALAIKEKVDGVLSGGGISLKIATSETALDAHGDQIRQLTQEILQKAAEISAMTREKLSKVDRELVLGICYDEGLLIDEEVDVVMRTGVPHWKEGAIYRLGSLKVQRPLGPIGIFCTSTLVPNLRIGEVIEMVQGARLQMILPPITDEDEGLASDSSLAAEYSGNDLLVLSGPQALANDGTRESGLVGPIDLPRNYEPQDAVIGVVQKRDGLATNTLLGALRSYKSRHASLGGSSRCTDIQKSKHEEEVEENFQEMFANAERVFGEITNFLEEIGVVADNSILGGQEPRAFVENGQLSLRQIFGYILSVQFIIHPLFEGIEAKNFDCIAYYLLTAYVIDQAMDYSGISGAKEIPVQAEKIVEKIFSKLQEVLAGCLAEKKISEFNEKLMAMSIAMQVECQDSLNFTSIEDYLDRCGRSIGSSIIMSLVTAICSQGDDDSEATLRAEEKMDQWVRILNDLNTAPDEAGSVKTNAVKIAKRLSPQNWQEDLEREASTRKSTLHDVLQGLSPKFRAIYERGMYIAENVYRGQGYAKIRFRDLEQIMLNYATE